MSLNGAWLSEMTRPGRHAPSFPTDDLAVPVPPSIPRSRRGTVLIPVLGIAAMLGTFALLWLSGPMGARSPLTMMLPVTALVSGIGMFVQSGGGRELVELDVHRIRFIEHLGLLGERLGEAAKLQYAAMHWIHPQPSVLWTLAGDRRMWERQPGDSDFLHARVGVGDQRLCRRLAVPALPASGSLDQVSASALRRLVRLYSVISDAPIAVALRGVPAISISGDPAQARSLARAVICQLAMLHGPDHLSIEVRAGDDLMDQWDWIKWLPHSSCRSSSGRRHSVLVIDGKGSAGGLPPGMTAIVLPGSHRAPEPVGALGLRVSGRNFALHAGRTDEVLGRPDGLTLPEAKACARRMSTFGRGRSVIGDLDMWRSELGLDDLEAGGPDLLWERLTEYQRLCVPLGTTTAGNLLSLNIREAIEDGIGPHGLCVGATGSGKSELLRTLVLGMIARHSPDELNLVLVDFKGGATFLDFSSAHHVAAIITNLSDEAYLVERMKDALAGEVHRRQQQLRRAGNVADISAYRARRRTDASLPPMPALFMVVDEFAELLAQHPDFIEVFSSIGRLGRSLGIHMLLASQRLEESRLRGLESHLSYRICLKMLTAGESRSVLGVTDAADLPAVPGAAILRSSDGTLTRFRAVRVAAPKASVVAESPGTGAVSRFSSDRGQPPETLVNTNMGPTVMAEVIGALKGRGPAAHQIWLKPLHSEPKLVRLVKDSPPPSPTSLAAPIGVIDFPFEQRRAPLIVDLGGMGGNVAIVGAPQTGKSTALRTLVTAMAVIHSPARILFYCIDFGGGALSGLSAIPHVGSIAMRAEHALIRRTVAHVESLVRSRGPSFGRGGDVCLVIDGWAAFRDEFSDLEPAVNAIAGQGLSVGVHLVLTASRWADFRTGLKDQIGTRLELRLADPVDSEIDRRQAAMVPKRLPGRGIVDGGDHFVLAQPDFSRVDLSHERVPPVPVLPEIVDIDEVAEVSGGPAVIRFGLGERELSPLAMDFTHRSHLIIIGDGECGKTSVLRALGRQLVAVGSSDQTQLFVIDYRRTLLGTFPPDHLSAYVFSNSALVEQLPVLIELLESRIPTSGLTVDQLRDGSWWAGPHYFVIIDDYDLVAEVGDSLRPLLRLIPHARDIGLHLVIARRCSGVSRAMFEPLLSQIRDSGCPVLLMNGSPEEGSVVRGRRPASQPVGRGLWVDGDDAEVVQVGWCPP